MADEPTASRVCVSDAHDDNGGQREPSCNNSIDAHSSAMLSDYRKVMEAHDADSGKAPRGLEPSRASVLAAELHDSASPGALSERQLSSAARGVVSTSDGFVKPDGVRLDVAIQRRAGGADVSTNVPGETRLHDHAAADATAAVGGIFRPAAENIPPSDGRYGLQLREVGTSSLLGQKSAGGSGDGMPSDAVDEPSAASAEATGARLRAVDNARVRFSRGRSSHAPSSGVQDPVLCPRAASEPPPAGVGSVVVPDLMATPQSPSAFVEARPLHRAPAPVRPSAHAFMSAASLQRLRLASRAAYGRCPTAPPFGEASAVTAVYGANTWPRAAHGVDVSDSGGGSALAMSQPVHRSAGITLSSSPPASLASSSPPVELDRPAPVPPQPPAAGATPSSLPLTAPASTQAVEHVSTAAVSPSVSAAVLPPIGFEYAPAVPGAVPSRAPRDSHGDGGVWDVPLIDPSPFALPAAPPVPPAPGWQRGTYEPVPPVPGWQRGRSPPPRVSSLQGAGSDVNGARYAASAVPRHAPLPRVRACFDGATQAVMMAPGQFKLHSSSMVSAKALKSLSVVAGEYRNWRHQFELLLTTVGITHLLSVVGTVVRGSDGAHYVYSFAAESYPAFSLARTVDAIIYAMLCVAYDGPLADEARLQGRTLQPSSGYRAIEFLDRVNRSTVWQLKQLRLKPQKLRLNGGDVLSFLKEAQLLRTRLISEGLEPRDMQMIEQLEDQWHRWYRKQPSNGMIIELNDIVTHAIVYCEGQFDVVAQVIQTWAKGEGGAIRWDSLRAKAKNGKPDQQRKRISMASTGQPIAWQKGLSQKVVSAVCRHCAAKKFPQPWRGKRQEVTPGFEKLIRKWFCHDAKDCPMRKHPDRYCDECGGRKLKDGTEKHAYGCSKSTQQVSTKKPTKRVSVAAAQCGKSKSDCHSDDDDDDEFGTESVTIFMFRARARVSLTRSLPPDNSLPKLPDGMLADGSFVVRFHIDSGAQISITGDDRFKHLIGVTQSEPVSTILESFNGDAAARTVRKYTVSLEPARSADARQQQTKHDGAYRRLALLQHVDYAPGIGVNLLSASALTDAGATLKMAPEGTSLSWASTFDDNTVSNHVLLPIDLQSGMPVLDAVVSPVTEADAAIIRRTADRDGSALVAATRKREHPTLSADQWKLWHTRLGHIHRQLLESVARVHGLCGPRDCAPASLNECSACGLGTGRAAAQSKRPRSLPDEFGFITFFDLNGPITPVGINGEKYKLAFVDSATHFKTMSHLAKKPESIDEIKRYFNINVFPIKQARRWPYVYVQTDKGTEWGPDEVNELKPWCEANGVKMMFAGTAQPNQIGLVERWWGTENPMVRKLLLHQRLLATHWPFASFEAVRIGNVVFLVRNTGKTAYELRYGKPPLEFIKRQRQFGCVAYKVAVDRAAQRPTLRADEDGLVVPYSKPYILVGQSQVSNEYELLDINTGRTILSSHIRVVESDATGPGMSPAHGPLDILAAAKGDPPIDSAELLGPAQADEAISSDDEMPALVTLSSDGEVTSSDDEVISSDDEVSALLPASRSDSDTDGNDSPARISPSVEKAETEDASGGATSQSKAVLDEVPPTPAPVAARSVAPPASPPAAGRRRLRARRAHARAASMGGNRTTRHVTRNGKGKRTNRARKPNLTWTLKRDRKGNRFPMEQYVGIPRAMCIEEIARGFGVEPDRYFEFLRTYDAFSPQGKMFAKTLKKPVYLAMTEVPIPFDHPDWKALISHDGPQDAKELIDQASRVAQVKVNNEYAVVDWQTELARRVGLTSYPVSVLRHLSPHLPASPHSALRRVLEPFLNPICNKPPRQISILDLHDVIYFGHKFEKPYGHFCDDPFVKIANDVLHELGLDCDASRFITAQRIRESGLVNTELLLSTGDALLIYVADDLQLGHGYMPFEAPRAQLLGHNLLGLAWQSVRTTLRERGMLPSSVYRGSQANWQMITNTLERSAARSEVLRGLKNEQSESPVRATGSKERIVSLDEELQQHVRTKQWPSAWTFEVGGEPYRLPPSPKASRRRIYAAKIKKKIKRRKRPLPSEARDPKHSFKCNPDIAAAQVFTPLTMDEVEQCLDRDLWLEAIEKEATAIRDTFKPVAAGADEKPIDTVWVFKAKVDPTTGKVAKLKARLTVRGFNMQKGIHYLESHAPTIASESVRLLIAEASKRRAAGSAGDLRSADISSAFTNGKWQEGERVTLRNFELSGIALADNEVLLLLGTLYGCKNSAAAFYRELRRHLESIGFVRSTADSCVFISEDASMFIGIHVDDMILFSTAKQYDWFCEEIGKRFKFTKDGLLTAVLGMTVERIGSGYQVAQTRYIESVLDRFGMTDCRPHWTPCDVGALIDELSTKSSPAADITKYREVTGSLNYLATMTRPDILYALSRLQEHAHNPKIEHAQAANLLLRYVKATKSYALHFSPSCDQSALEGTLDVIEWRAPDGGCSESVHRWSDVACNCTDIEVYSDSDWAGDRGSRRSTLSAVIKVCGITVAAKSRKSKLVCLSSCEAELDAAVLAMKLAIDVSGLQLQLRSPPVTWPAHMPQQPMPFYIDNQAALTVIQNDIRGRNRHFDIRLQFIRQNINISRFLASYCPSDENVADGGTKALNRIKQKVSAQRLLGLPDE